MNDEQPHASSDDAGQTRQQENERMTELRDDKLVIITGSVGMLGSALMELAPAAVRAVGVDIADGDLSTDAGITSALGPSEPDVVIHCAGYTDVDGATSEPELAQRHNALATEKVAGFCAERGARLIYISTDYVFDGTRGSPYTEEDTPKPINAYGRSKLAGEQATQQIAADCLIVRTQWLFGPGGRNFVAGIVDHARQGGEVWGVVDEIGSPTYTRDMATALWQLVERPVSGIVHLTNSGYCSRAELARGALDAAGLAEVPISEISCADWDSPTQRPAFSVLDNRRWRELGLTPLRAWQEAMAEYVKLYLLETCTDRLTEFQDM